MSGYFSERMCPRQGSSQGTLDLNWPDTHYLSFAVLASHAIGGR